MSRPERPKILCSACLTFCNCRYDGSRLNNEFVEMLKPYVDFVTVCPEMGIGEPSPREAIRIVTKSGVSRLMGSYSGIDHTDKMNQYIANFFATTEVAEIDGIILKGKSPTCGFKDVKHYGNFGKVPALMTKTSGFFGGAVKNRFKELIIEDEGRLLNREIRDHFLTSVFLRFGFRQVKASSQPLKALNTYHTNNKYLLMAYNQAALKRLGTIVANHAHLESAEVISAYDQELNVIYASQLKLGKNVNMLLHLFGYFKNDLSADEKKFFLEQVALYQKDLVTFSALLLILKAWVVRFDEAYLKEQTIFSHYPIDLGR